MPDVTPEKLQRFCRLFDRLADTAAKDAAEYQNAWLEGVAYGYRLLVQALREDVLGETPAEPAGKESHALSVKEAERVDSRERQHHHHGDRGPREQGAAWRHGPEGSVGAPGRSMAGDPEGSAAGS